MMRLVRRFGWLLGVLALCAAPVFGQNAALHRVTYLTSTTAYVDAGRDDGLHPGNKVEVIRAGKTIAVLRVTDVSSHRAACVIESSTAAPAVGDTIRYTPGEAPPDSSISARVVTPAIPVAEEPVERPSAESWARRNGLRGRIGVRYLGVFDQGGFGGDVKQPSADVRIDGNRVGGSSFDAQVDVRARHTLQTVADGREFNDGEARWYRLNTRWRSTGDRYRFTVGRQFSSALANLSTFDGAQFEYDKPRWGLGAFGGTQPEPIDYGFSTDVTEYGAFARFRATPGARVRWETIVAGIGSYEQGKINREYVALLGNMTSAKVSLMLQQDIDVNRGWKRDAEGSQVSFSNTFATARLRASKSLDFDAGYDNRRNVRLYRDYVSPETDFDDTYRQGMWGGVGVGFASRYRVGASARSSTGGSSGDAMSYTLNATASHVTSAHVQLRLRSTRYENDNTDGWMHTVACGSAIGARFMVELFGGYRDDHSKLFAVPDASTTWFGLDTDVDLGNSLYLNLSGERNDNGAESYDQVYTGLSWRF